MRAIYTLPLVAAMMLAACGGNEATDEEGLSADEVAAEAQEAAKPLPGQYTTALELLEFDAPGVDDAAKAQMREMFASGLAEGNTFCLTEEDAAKNGPKQMVQNLAEANCKMNTFNVSGSSVVADMQCPGEAGANRTVHLEGEMTAESSTMTMDMSQQIPNIGETSMKLRVSSQRTGDCAA